MNFNEYQKQCLDTAIYPNVGSNIYYPALGLGEAGEICNQIKKVMRDDGGVITESRREKLKGEIGDLLYYCAALCSELKLEMQEVAEYNVEKLNSRKQRGVLQGSGDER